MNNALVTFGTEPRLLGLATIGGLLSLAYLLWQIARFGFEKRVLLLRGYRAQQRKNIVADIKEFRVALSRKRAGLSDLAIAIPRLQIAVVRLSSILVGFVLAGLNAIIAVVQARPAISATVAAIMLAVILYDTFRFVHSLQRALWVLAAVNYPAFYRVQLGRRARKLKRNVRR